MKDTFFSLYDGILELINGGIEIIIALAVVGFLWGIVKMLFASDNAIAQKEAKSFMMYGVFTLFVMTSVWGLVNLLSGAITPYTEPDPIYNNGDSDTYDKGGFDTYNNGNTDTYNNGGSDSYNNGNTDTYNNGGFDSFEELDTY